jgi:hypothetical protein
MLVPSNRVQEAMLAREYRTATCQEKSGQGDLQWTGLSARADARMTASIGAICFICI